MNNNIYEQKDGVYIKEFINIDLKKRYVEEYKERSNNTNYYNPEVYKLRKNWVESRVDITKSFDYGAGLKPYYKQIENNLQPLGIYDKYQEPYTEFNRDLFNQSHSILFFDVVEHFLQPEMFLSILPQKNLLISVPCVPESNFKNLNQIKNWKHYRPEHYIYANREGWELILKSSGWNIIECGEWEAPIREDILCIFAKRE